MAFNGKDLTFFKDGTPFAAATDGTVTITNEMIAYANKDDGGFEAALPGIYEMQISASNLLDLSKSGTQYITELKFGAGAFTSVQCEMSTTGTFTMNVINQDCKGNIDSNGRQFRVVSPGTISGNISVEGRLKLDGSGLTAFEIVEKLKEGEEVEWRVRNGSTDYATAKGFVETVDISAPDNDSVTFTVTINATNGGNVLVSDTKITGTFRRTTPTVGINKYFLVDGYITNETFTFTQNEAPTGTIQFQSTGEFDILTES